MSFFVDIDDLNEVFCQVVNLRAHWKTLGLTLGIKYDEIEAIETDKSSSEDRLMELLASWLRIQNKAQSKPSWKSLCDAVRGIDKTKAEKIAKEHQCSCDECAGKIFHLMNYCESMSNNICRLYTDNSGNTGMYGVISLTGFFSPLLND